MHDDFYDSLTEKKYPVWDLLESFQLQRSLFLETEL